MLKSERYKLPNTVDLKPASKRQIDYASSLGICLPKDSTVSDAGAIIERVLDDDIGASKGLLEYADRSGIVCSPYAGNRFLHNLLFDNLKTKDKAAFFCFCVYKFHTEDPNENLKSHRYQEIFDRFGKEYSESFYFKTSMDEYCGEELIAFGKSIKENKDGTKQTIYGGSIHTTAYKMAYDYLKRCSLI